MIRFTYSIKKKMQSNIVWTVITSIVIGIGIGILLYKIIVTIKSIFGRDFYNSYVSGIIVEIIGAMLGGIVTYLIVNWFINEKVQKERKKQFYQGLIPPFDILSSIAKNAELRPEVIQEFVKETAKSYKLTFMDDDATDLLFVDESFNVTEDSCRICHSREVTVKNKKCTKCGLSCYAWKLSEQEDLMKQYGIDAKIKFLLNK